MSLNANSIWAECLSSFHDEVSSHAFKTWFAPLKPLSLSETDGQLELALEIPSSFYREWLEQNYRDLLRSTVDGAVGRPTSVRFKVGTQETDIEVAPPPPPRRKSSEASLFARSLPSGPKPYAPQVSVAPPLTGNSLNDTYTFDSFIEGSCNQMARSAAVAIAKRPGQTSFNPFLVYGGVGLGKTHLVQAIGTHVRSTGAASRVWYVSSERFTSEFVQAVKSNRLKDFADYYESMDVLIVDDIQFFGGKEKTQEEFFKIFNELHRKGKQLVLCADRPPRDIRGVEERLLSRFSWGLSTEVKAPDLDTRLAILRHKAQQGGLPVPQDVLAFVGERVASNIRELEGALNRLRAHAQLQRRRIDIGFAREALKDVIAEAPFQFEVPDIQRAVCEHYGLPVQILSARTRKREAVDARQLAMYLCKRFTNHTYEKIGSYFGGRDHSTVIHGCKTVEDRMEVDAAYREEVERLEGELRERV